LYIITPLVKYELVAGLKLGLGLENIINGINLYISTYLGSIFRMSFFSNVNDTTIGINIIPIIIIYLIKKCK
jgi:hypothetical protein